MKVAILGASGIGKNHARWFHKHGCDVSAFLGSSATTTGDTMDALKAQFPFEGIGYTDLSTLLREEQPDAVCIATPPALHFAQALDCLESGVHVLCEKPLVYAPTRSQRENRDGAKELVKVAKKKKLMLGVQLQYAGAVPALCRLLNVVPAEIGDFAVEIETVNPNTPRCPKELWADLGPHALSASQILAGEGAKLDENSIQFTANESADMTEIVVRWRVQCADGRLLTVRSIGRYLDPQVHNRAPRRRFAFNGRVIYYSGLQTRAGNYLAQYMTPDGYTSHYDDPVDYLIGNFVRACRGTEPLLVPAELGLQNLDWLLKISDHAPESVAPVAAPAPTTAAEPEPVAISDAPAPVAEPVAEVAAFAMPIVAAPVAAAVPFASDAALAAPESAPEAAPAPVEADAESAMPDLSFSSFDFNDAPIPENPDAQTASNGTTETASEDDSSDWASMFKLT